VQEFEKISANPASIGELKRGWLSKPNLGNYGMNYKLRAGIALSDPEVGYYRCWFRTAMAIFSTAGRNTKSPLPKINSHPQVHSGPSPIIKITF
jgi:hypothetical protein